MFSFQFLFSFLFKSCFGGYFKLNSNALLSQSMVGDLDWWFAYFKNLGILTVEFPSHGAFLGQTTKAYPPINHWQTSSLHFSTGLCTAKGTNWNKIPTILFQLIFQCSLSKNDLDPFRKFCTPGFLQHLLGIWTLYRRYPWNEHDKKPMIATSFKLRTVVQRIMWGFSK